MLRKVLIWKVTLELRPEKQGLNYAEDQRRASRQEGEQDKDPGVGNDTVSLRDRHGQCGWRVISKVKNHASHGKGCGFSVTHNEKL